jgi:hypothetical protein
VLTGQHEAIALQAILTLAITPMLNSSLNQTLLEVTVNLVAYTGRSTTSKGTSPRVKTLYKWAIWDRYRVRQWVLFRGKFHKITSFAL